MYHPSSQKVIDALKIDLQSSCKPTEWLSCAEWPDGHIYYLDPPNVTTDRHSTKEEAEGVCALLERNGFAGEKCHFPVRTWVEPAP